jgi:rod shape-determining protein MreC
MAVTPWSHVFGLIKMYREVLALVALLTVAGLTFATRRTTNGPPTSLDRAVGWAAAPVTWVTSPIERGVTWVIGGGIDVFQSFASLRHVREENVRLNRELLGLRGELVHTSELAQENERLQGLLGLTQAEMLPLIAAPVIGDDIAPDSLSRMITIGVGRDRGVERGMAVISSSGVVGRVQSASAGSARVQLIIDRNSAVAARVDRSRARATVTGLGNDRRCKLDFALRSDDIEEGDLLVTSGTDGVYPAGLPVGKVVSLKRKTSGMMLVASVAPAADTRRLEEVMVVLSKVGGTDLPAASR